MSVFYGVRLTDEMDARIQATGKGKSAVVQEALESYFGGSHQEAAKTEQIVIERAKPEKMIIKSPAVNHQPALSVERCSKPDHLVFKNGVSWICMTCKKEQQ